MARNRQLASRARLIARDTIYGFRHLRDESPRAKTRAMVKLNVTQPADRSVNQADPANKIVTIWRFRVEGKAKERAEKVAENVADMSKKLFNGDGVKKFAAWYIDTSEKVANHVLHYQATATEWAKARGGGGGGGGGGGVSSKFVKRSAEVAR